MILLRRNSQKDSSFSINNEITEGTLVAVKEVEAFTSDYATVKYILPKSHMLNYYNHMRSGDINCFDYIGTR